MVITAFTGNVSAAYVEGKSSAEVIVTTLESGKAYFSSLLKIDLVRYLSYSFSHPSLKYVTKNFLTHINIKVNDSL